MISFDGAARLITTDQETLGVREVYSRWAEWVLLSDNAKWLPAFSVIGGEPLGGGLSIPIYAFLLNGWRIRPKEASHTLNVVDGILLVSGGGDPFVNTLGSFVVRVNYQQPVTAITVGGADPWNVLSEGKTMGDWMRLMTSILLANGKFPPGAGAFESNSQDNSRTRVEGTMAPDGTRTVTKLDGAA